MFEPLHHQAFLAHHAQPARKKKNSRQEPKTQIAKFVFIPVTVARAALRIVTASTIFFLHGNKLRARC